MVWWMWAAQMNPLLSGLSEYKSSSKPVDGAISELSQHGLQACCVWSPADGFSHFSENWEHVTGQMPADCLGELWLEHWQEDFRAVFDEALSDIFSSSIEMRPESLVIEGDVMHGAGEWITLELAMIPSGMVGDQRLTLLVCDVSAARDMEHQVALAELQSQAVEHCRSSFLSNMSHELRTPLNAIMGFAQLLESKQISDEESAQEYLRHIRLSGEELLTKISDLIELANIDAGQAKLKEEPINVSEAIAAVVEMQSHRAFDKGVSIHQDTNCPHLVMMADRAKLMHCIAHQLMEAIDHSKEESLVTISYRADAEKGVRIAVHDNGHSISQRRLQNIRSSLHRKRSYYQTDIEDISIGLAVCKEMMELHGGGLTVDSKIDRGTITTLRLPAQRIVSLSAKVKKKNKQFG